MPSDVSDDRTKTLGMGERVTRPLCPQERFHGLTGLQAGTGPPSGFAPSIGICGSPLGGLFTLLRSETATKSRSPVGPCCARHTALHNNSRPLEREAISEQYCWASPNTVHLTFERMRIAGSRLLVGPRDLRIGYPEIFRFTPLRPKRPFRCGTRI